MPFTWNKPIPSHSPDDTWAVAAALLDALPGGAVIALHGQLGAGKTCFVQGLARALGVREPVTSPTFTIVNEYNAKRPLYHIDLYRLQGPDDILAMGFDEYLESNGITAIEWAERAGALLPADTVHVQLSPGPTPDDRTIRIRRDTTEDPC